MLLLSSLLPYPSSSCLFHSFSYRNYSNLKIFSSLKTFGFVLFLPFTLVVCISAFSASISALSIHTAFSPGNAIFLVAFVIIYRSIYLSIYLSRQIDRYRYRYSCIDIYVQYIWPSTQNQLVLALSVIEFDNPVLGLNTQARNNQRAPQMTAHQPADHLIRSR